MVIMCLEREKSRVKIWCKMIYAKVFKITYLFSQALKRKSVFINM